MTDSQSIKSAKSIASAAAPTEPVSVYRKFATRTLQRTDAFSLEPPGWWQSLDAGVRPTAARDASSVSFIYSKSITGFIRAVTHRAIAELWAARSRVQWRTLCDLPTSEEQGDAAREVLRLILDGALEIETDNGYVSGPAAWRTLFGDCVIERCSGTIADLSIAALRFATDLDIRNINAIAASLYGFNFAPATPAWRRRLPSPAAVDRFLDTDTIGRNPSLSRTWKRQPAQPGFICWTAASAPSRKTAKGKRYKLYISPGIECMPECFRRAVEIIPHHNAHSFKVGADLCGLLRADKMIVYLNSFSCLSALAKDLESELRSLRVCGVPFTASLESSGLLSWGIDPDPREDGSDAMSWRIWICRKLAAALLTACEADNSDMEPWEFATRRILLENVDSATWRPSKRFASRNAPTGARSCST